MDIKTPFPGKLAIQQRVLTPYRAAFFDSLAEACTRGLIVCAGLPRTQESIAVTDHLQVARYVPLQNLHLFCGALYLCFQRGLRRWLQDWDPDVLILEANPRYLAAPVAVHWMKLRGRPVIGWGLGAPPVLGMLADMHNARRQTFLKKFDALITYSRQGAGEYAAMGFPAEKIFVAPNAAARRPISSPPERTPAFLGTPSILFVGRLQARKRVDLLLRACASLPMRLQPHLVIVGDGPESAALKALAVQVYPRAEFPGAKHGDDLAGFFTHADLFVLPGTGGLAVQEAMSFALPVIMGKGDGTNDDLVRPSNGWQIQDNDLVSLRAALTEALSDAGRLRRMGAESHRIVSQEINLEAMVAAFLDALASVQGKEFH